MLGRLLVAAFLLAHASIHAGYVRRPPAKPGDPPWPFDLARSWLVSRLHMRPEVVRALGLALVAVTLAGYGLAVLATVGVLPAGTWAPTVVVGSLGSLALVACFFHPWLIVGIAVDLLLLWVALVADWTPDLID